MRGSFLKKGETVKILVTPNAKPKPNVMMALVVINVLIAVGLWCFSPASAIPSFMKVMSAGKALWFEGLLVEVIASVKLNFVSILFTIALALTISYSYILPIFRPFVLFITGLRAASMVGVSIIFLLIMPDGYWMKVGLMVFGMVPWFVTGMVSVIDSIPEHEYDYARTLRMSEWRVAYEVVIRGRLAEAIDVFRQVAAMGWMLLTMVEKISRADGGVGALLCSQERFFALDKIYFIQICVVIIGLYQDYLIQKVKKIICPYIR